jgi:hypothetical protein
MIGGLVMSQIEIKLADRLVRLNQFKLKELVKDYPDYSFRFFIYGTDGLILNAETKNPYTADDMLNMKEKDFQIKDFYTSNEEKIVEVDVVLFSK